MKHWDAILSVVRAGIAGDSKKVRAYVKMLAENMDQDEPQLAADLKRELRTPASKTLGAARAVPAAPNSRVPMDPESRFSIADEEEVTNPPRLVLQEPVRRGIEEFLAFAKGADRLAEHGLGGNISLLLIGPPGSGKTESARLIAYELGLPLLTARSDTLVSSYLGSTSKNLRQLFAYAAQRPCVLFLDEFDALAKMRDDRHELGELKRVVVALLQNVDALPASTVLLAATNHAHLLDPAVGRRFAFRLHLGPLELDDRRTLLSMLLGNQVPSKEIVALARVSDGLSNAAIKTACDNARRIAIIEGRDLQTKDVGLRVLRERHGEEGTALEQWVRSAKEIDPKLSVRDVASLTGLSTGAAHKKGRRVNEQ